MHLHDSVACDDWICLFGGKTAAFCVVSLLQSLVSTVSFIGIFLRVLLSRKIRVFEVSLVRFNDFGFHFRVLETIAI